MPNDITPEKDAPSSYYKDPIPLPGETWDAYVDRAATVYAELHRADGWTEKECTALYESFVWRKKAATAAMIERMVKERNFDDRRLYLWPKLYYNYTTMVPLDYEVTADNLQDAEIRLAALIAEHNAQEALGSRRKIGSIDPGLELILHMPADPRMGDTNIEKRRDELFALRQDAAVDPVKQAEISAEINSLADPWEILQAENMAAMKNRKLAAEECIKRLKSAIQSVKKIRYYDIKDQITDEKAEKKRLLAEKEARLAAERAARTRVMEERGTKLTEERAEKLRLAREKEARIAAEKAEKLRLAREREERKAEYNRLVAEQIEAKKLKMQKELKRELKKLQKE